MMDAVGVAAVNDAVWSKLARDWNNLRVVPEEFIAAADTVVVVGRDVGRQSRSGAELDAQVVHSGMSSTEVAPV